MLITDAQLWSQSGRALRRLPLRMAKALHLRLAHLELAHPQPETLGQWAAWHAGIGYALGRPLPLQLHFEERQMRVAGEITARANLWDLIWLLMASLYDLPWRPVLRAFRLGFTHSRLPGWREKGLSLILAIFRHHG